VVFQVRLQAFAKLLTEVFGSGFNEAIALSRTHQTAIEGLNILQMIEEKQYRKERTRADLSPIDLIDTKIQKSFPILLKETSLSRKCV
jgi:hypothetical protein